MHQQGYEHMVYKNLDKFMWHSKSESYSILVTVANSNYISILIFTSFIHKLWHII
jgi:hypothetical protein